MEPLISARIPVSRWKEGFDMAKYYIVSGGFDPIHEGHVENIKESRLESDGVIALVNSDEWLCRKKGRNFMSFYTRSVIIENMKGVVDVIGFDDSDGSCCDGLRRVRAKYPDAELVFAKGGDRTADNIPEIPVCRELDIEIRYHVGFAISGKEKPNSSSWLLKSWDERNKNSADGGSKNADGGGGKKK
jgi:D-beta-D-heptose 7-phosphate kinase/D-beta-D-heptose 1-phosphate adenosyltransferase